MVVCAVFLVLAVGVYAYSSMNNTNTKTFFFESKKSWVILPDKEPPDNVVETNETYHMKLVFAIKGENLSITAEIDDKVLPHGGSQFLGLVFDINHSGAIEDGEPAYMLYIWNESRDPVRHNTAYKSYETPYLTFALCEAIPSPFHTCIFNSESGYTFKIQIPLEDLNLVNDLVYMCFSSTSSGFYEEFNFGLEV